MPGSVDVAIERGNLANVAAPELSLRRVASAGAFAAALGVRVLED